MSIRKIYLPGVDELKARMENDAEETIRWLAKADAIIGPTESQDYVKWVFSQNKEVQ